MPLSTGDLFSYLLLARFFPLLPYSVLNVISGVLKLPLVPFFITLVLGSFPFNFVTVSVGSVVALAASDPDTPLGDKIWTWQMFGKLVGVTVVSVAPLIWKKQIQRALGNPRLAQALLAFPGRVRHGFKRAGEGIVQRVGISLGASEEHPSTTPDGPAYQSLSSPPPLPSQRRGESVSSSRASHETTDSEGGRAWRHKWNPSWGGDGFRLIEQLANGGKAPGREGELLGRWEEEEGLRREAVERMLFEPGRGQTM